VAQLSTLGVRATRFDFMKVNKYQITPHKNCDILVLKPGNLYEWVPLKAGIQKEVTGVLHGVNPESTPDKPTGQVGGFTCALLMLDLDAPLPFKFSSTLTVESFRSYME